MHIDVHVGCTILEEPVISFNESSDLIFLIGGHVPSL